MTKVSTILSLLFVPCLFASCGKQKPVSMQRNSSLRDEAAILESRLTWEQELHPGDTKKKGGQPKIARSVAVTPDSLLAVKGAEGKKSYPALRGFARLDTSAYSEAQRAALDGFCTALVRNQGAEDFIARGGLYTLFLFRYNLEAQGKKPSAIISYILGEPFINENECQCPVRFVFADKGTADAFIYLIKTNQDWKINQIAYKKGAGNGGK